MMYAKAIAGTMLVLLAVSVVALPAYAQPAPTPQVAQAPASKQGATATYQCAVTTKDAGIEKTTIRATSEDAARQAAARKFGSRSTGSKGVSCARTAGATASPDSAAQKEAKTRAATPTPFDPIRPGVEFLADGSCLLSQQAVVAHPDARQNCQSDPNAKGVTFGCPAKYCETLK